MYKLLFAEDETATREGILACIDWNGLNLTDVKSAKNGFAAYQIALEWIPDILLTDIRMPQMNGLELSKKIRELNPNCSILIISGYAEVDYLKSAIKLKAIDFVDKPLQVSNLTEQLKKAIAEQNSIRQQLTYTRHRIGKIFLDSQNDSESICQMLHFLNYPLGLQDLCCSFIIRILPIDAAVIEYCIGLHSYVKEMDQYLTNENIAFSYYEVDDDILQLQLFSNASDSFCCLSIAKQLIDIWTQRNEMYALHICIGTIEKIVDYSNSYAQAHLQEHNLFLHAENFIHQNDSPVVLQKYDCTPYLDCFKADIEQYIMQKNVDAFKDSVLKLQHYFKMYTNISKEDVILFYSHILFLILRSSSNINLQSDKSTFQELSECNVIEDATCCILDFFLSTHSYDAKKDTNNIADEIIQIIYNNYQNKELSLEDVSKKVNLSQSYICVRFKAYTGKTLIQYINEFRIQSSLSLLADSNRKINDIAESVGFDNGNYFTKIFKRLKGITPADYRDSLRHSSDG